MLGDVCTVVHTAASNPQHSTEGEEGDKLSARLQKTA